MAINIAGQIATLRSDIETNRRLRQDAETRLALSRSRLNQIDQRLQEIGINPDNVDEQISELEQQFTILADSLSVELKTEAENYNKIIEQTKPALGEK